MHRFFHVKLTFDRPKHQNYFITKYRLKKLYPHEIKYNNFQKLT